MNRDLHVLILEDVPTDAELIQFDGLYARLYRMQFRENGQAGSGQLETGQLAEEAVATASKRRSFNILSGLAG